MARSLSDDPVKLERELSGVLRRAHAITKKLQDIEREREADPDVVYGDELHRRVEEAKARIVSIGAATPEMLAGVELDDAAAVDF